MQNLTDILEIVIITFNRKKDIQNTLESILHVNSPIKNIQITILDNKSTDGTTELIQQYVLKHHNIKHVVHNHNIGGDANALRAFEIAKKQYLWVLCDDDNFNWNNWQEVEVAMEKNYDAIIVANFDNPEAGIFRYPKQLSFIPAAIYKTENINGTVLFNAYFSLQYKFPQLAICCYLINNNKSFYLCKKPIVILGEHPSHLDYKKGLNKELHPYSNEYFFDVGFINAIQMIQDRKLVQKIIEDFSVSNSKSLARHLSKIIKTMKKKKSPLMNYVYIYSSLTFKNKLLYIYLLLTYKIRFLNKLLRIV